MLAVPKISWVPAQPLPLQPASLGSLLQQAADKGIPEATDQLQGKHKMGEVVGEMEVGNILTNLIQSSTKANTFSQST